MYRKFAYDEGYSRTRTMKVPGKYYSELRVEMNYLLEIAKMKDYNVSTDRHNNQNSTGAFIYRFAKGQQQYRLAFLHVNEKVYRIIAFFSSKDVDQLVDDYFLYKKKEQKFTLAPIQELIKRL